jgi:thiol-disulfide isomerase/thioredoxin
MLAPAWADDKRADETAAVKSTSPAEKLSDLQKDYDKRFAQFVEESQKAKTPEERAKIGERAQKEFIGPTAKKMLALATETPKDPVAVQALIWICSYGNLTAEVPEAFGRLLEAYPTDKTRTLWKHLANRPDRDAMIRDIRARTTNPSVKVRAGLFIAESIRDKNDVASTVESEKLLEAVLAQAKESNAPHQAVSEAEEALKVVKTLGIGKMAPASESKTLAGKDANLADLKGKVVVLDFWATWCGPCVRMIPHERQLVKKLEGKPFALVSVSADAEMKHLTDFLEKRPMPWTHWFAGPGGDLLKAWNIQTLPTVYVIDAKGVIRGKFVGGGDDVEKEIDALVELALKDAR